MKNGIGDHTAGSGNQYKHNEGRDLNTGQFLKGYRGGPGRHTGSKYKLGEKFIADLYQDWQEHGFEVLERARNEKLADYLKVIAMVLPKDIKVSLETMSDGELAQKIEQLTQSLGIELVPRAPKTIEHGSHVLPNSDDENEDDNKTE